MSSIGFMQGRLVDTVNGQIQAFPARDWQLEFFKAREVGLSLLEWTLDVRDLEQNPLNTVMGRNNIEQLKTELGIDVDSVTADFFMQEPFFQVSGGARKARLDRLKLVIESCQQIGVKILVLPLVDQSSVRTSVGDCETVVNELNELALGTIQSELRLAFEFDFPPELGASFIRNFTEEKFGVNYDIGNSAGSGFDPRKEFDQYGSRIINVHVKDRHLNGNTCPLGDGAANFEVVFKLLKQSAYQGNYILQTARDPKGRHCEVIREYRDMVRCWLNDE